MKIAMIILLSFLYVLVEFYLIRAMRNGFHILQLENYHRDRYGKWIKENKAKSYPFFRILISILPIFFVWNTLALTIASIVCLSLNILGTKKKKEKKEFVITNRIVREYVIASIVWLIDAVASVVTYILIPSDYFVIYIGTLVVALIQFFTYRYVYLIDLINAPIQNHISNKFINNAKTKLTEMSDLTVIGITGSFGKTSTKHAVTTILSQKFNPVMTPGSYNTPMGVTRTVNEMLKATNDVFVCEMGAKYVGDIKEICDIAKPKIGIVTAVGPMHLDTFKTIDNVRKTKFELIDSLPEDGIAIVNWEDENIRNTEINRPFIKYGLSSEADYYAENIEMNENGSEFDVVMPNKERIRISTKLLGDLNILNIVCAVAVADKLGMKENEIKLGAKYLKPVEHRLQLRRNLNGSLIIDDAYNSNVKGSRMALDVLSNFKTRKKIFITPGIVDLGEKSEEYNKDLGKYAANKCDIAILVGEKQAKPIKEGLLEEGMNADKIFVAENINVAITIMAQESDANSVVLLENDLPDNYL